MQLPPLTEERLLCSPAALTVTLDFDANITTGYEWNAAIVSGASVRLCDLGYVSDPNPEFMDGIGGTHYFELTALSEGDTVIRFRYSRGADEPGPELYACAAVDSDLVITVYDITDTVTP